MKEDAILEYIRSCGAEGATTQQLADRFSMQRTNMSAILNRLVAQQRIVKRAGKPVIFTAPQTTSPKLQAGFELLIGGDSSLKLCIQKAKAAILYPPHGLHALLVGPTGVGKTMFAELMHLFAQEHGTLGQNPPFVRFNCADYAANPQLLMSQLFGSVKGAFTGADADRTGLIAAANGGILFLDEVHRLPPEGQEMLFYIMDAKMYKPLGAVDFIRNIQVNLIAATTEPPETALLPTLLRRLQMVIPIPALNQRTLEERLELILSFFLQESAQTGRTIFASRSAVQHLLLYDCPGNIGQIKRDIQLGCANAYVDALSEGSESIAVDIGDFPEEVRQGALYYRAKQHEIDPLLGDIKLYEFSNDQITPVLGSPDALPTLNFSYEIEKLVEAYSAKALSEQELGELLAPEVDTLYKRFLDKTASLGEEEFLEMVDQRLLLYVEDFVSNVSYRLERELTLNVLRSIALHLQQSLSRFREKRHLRNYRLLETRSQFPKEYELCAEFTLMLEQIYSVRISVDEIAYLTRFLCTQPAEDQNTTAILILMHGESSARSMANVVRRLIGVSNVYAFDMLLNMPAKEAYQQVKELLKGLNLSSGLLILVDMGSLKVFGEMLSGDLGITVRVLDMVSTALALECTRLSLSGKRADEIYTIVKSEINDLAGLEHVSAEQFTVPENKSVIITLCMTGEGTARKLQKLVEDSLQSQGETSVLVHPLAVYSKEEMVSAISYIHSYSRILCIVGTTDPQMFDIPFVSVSELIIQKDYSRLLSVVRDGHALPRERLPNRYRSQLFEEFFAALVEQTPELDVSRFKRYIPGFLESLKELGYQDDWEQDVGLIFHIACLIEKLLLGQPSRDYEGADAFVLQYSNQLDYLHVQLHGFEEEFGFIFRVDDIIYILKIILKL